VRKRKERHREDVMMQKRGVMDKAGKRTSGKILHP